MGISHSQGLYSIGCRCCRPFHLPNRDNRLPSLAGHYFRPLWVLSRPYGTFRTRFIWATWLLLPGCLKKRTLPCSSQCLCSSCATIVHPLPHLGLILLGSCPHDLGTCRDRPVQARPDLEPMTVQRWEMSHMARGEVQKRIENR